MVEDCGLNTNNMGSNIYIFNNSNVSSRYGIGSYINKLVSYLKNDKNKSITVINLFSKCDKTGIEENEDYKRINIPEPYNAYTESHRKKYYRHVFFIIQPLINNQHHLCFHFNEIQQSPLIETVKESYSNSTVLLTIHYFPWIENPIINKSFNDILDNEINELVKTDTLNKYNNCFSQIDVLVCLSNYAKNILERYQPLFKKKIICIPNSIDEIEYPPLTTDKKNLLRSKYNFNSDHKIVLFVGRLHRAKGLEYLIDAFKKLLISNQNYRLLIAGEGDYNFFLKKCYSIWDKVIFTGFVDKDTLYDFYKLSDVGMLPSMNEQSSYTILEMATCHLKCIGTSMAGLAEMIDCMDGFATKINIQYLDREIYHNRFITDIANAIENVCNNGILNTTMSENFYAVHSFNNIKVKYIRLYENHH